MDLEALNDPDLVRDTPIGDLVVRRFGGVAHGVGVVNKHDAERSRLIHIVEPWKQGAGVLDAIYGKRFFESEAVVAIHERANAARVERDERKSALVSADMRRGLERFLNRHGDDGREALIAGRRR